MRSFRKSYVSPDIMCRERPVKLPQGAFAIVPTPAFVDCDEDILPAKRISQSDYGIVPVTSQNPLIVPMYTSDVHSFRSSSNRFVRGARKAAQNLRNVEDIE
jgi:hypothetical protein